MSFKISDFNEKTQSRIREQIERDAVRRVEAHQSEQAAAQTLERGLPERAVGAGCVVTLVSLVRRLFDDDNAVAALKPLRDAIAASLGIDDGDARLRFQYQQLQTKGREGVLVHIETRDQSYKKTSQRACR